MDMKVVVIADEYIYQLLHAYDEDTAKIFKVRADFDTSMNKNENPFSSLPSSSGGKRMKTS